MSKIYNRFESYADLRLNSDISVRRYHSTLTEWIKFVGEDRVFAPDLSDIIRWLTDQKKRPGQNSRIDHSKKAKLITWKTIENKFSILKGIYDFLVAYGDLPYNPFGHPQFCFKKKESDPKRPHELVPYEAVNKMLSLPSEASVTGLRDRALIALLFGAGLRSIEARNLLLYDLDETPKGTQFVRIRKGKKRFRVVALPDWAAAHVARYRAQREGETPNKDAYVFVRYKGKPKASTELPLAAKTLYSNFVSYAVEAGLPKTITPHCSRVTFGTRLLDDPEIDIDDVKEALGHTSVKVTEGYIRRYLDIDRSVGKKISYE